jgi:hypothetical protein
VIDMKRSTRFVARFLAVAFFLNVSSDCVSAQDAPASAPEKPALYNLPWLLRPAVPGTVFRLDETIAFFEDPASETSGTTYVTSLIASYKLAPEWSLVFRETWVSNDPPSGLADPPGDGFSNGLVGANYSCPFGDGWRWTGFLAATIPWGSGGGDSPDAGAAAAMSAAIPARSAMDNSLFAVNYWVAIAGIDLVYVSPAISLQAEATFFQLTHVRGPDTEDSSRTNFTAGVHAGHFFTPSVSLGAELRIQRWLTNSAPVRADPAARQQLTFGIGPRFHVKVGKSSWLRPGISYTRALDDPMARKNYDILQVDLPYAF